MQMGGVADAVKSVRCTLYTASDDDDDGQLRLGRSSGATASFSATGTCTGGQRRSDRVLVARADAEQSTTIDAKPIG